MYGTKCWKHLVLMWWVVWSYMWYSSGTKTGFVWIKYDIKLILQIFWKLSKIPRIYTIQSRSRPLGFKIWQLLRDFITLQHIWMMSSFLIRIHTNTCMVLICTSRSGTLMNLPNTAWGMKWYKFKVVLMFHQMST